jgi:hypothetical protein
VRIEEQSLVGREPELAALARLIGDAGLVGDGLRSCSARLASVRHASPSSRDDGSAVGLRCGVGSLLVDRDAVVWPWRQVLTNLLGETDLLDSGRFASQPELFAAVAETIEVRTRAQAVLVIFEDAHWAEPGSLALREFLSGVVAGQRLMLLVTARDDVVPLPAAAGVRSLPLAGLNRDATATVVQQIVGPEASQDFIAEVHRRTGGNPFFTSEVARLQVSRGTPTGAIPPACGRFSSIGSPGCPRSISTCSRWPAWSGRRTSASWPVSQGYPRPTSKPGSSSRLRRA